MPLPIIAVEIEPPEPPAHVAEVLIEACSQAAAPGHCGLAPGASGASHRAAVSWLDERRDHALIEVGLRDQERGAWQFRRLRFTRADAPEERWRAIGFAIASLAQVHDANDASPGIDDGPEPLDPEGTGSADRESAPDLPLALGLAGLIGSGFSGGPVGFGVSLEAAFRPGTWPVHPVLIASFNTANHVEVSGQWWRVAAGVGSSWVLGPLRVGGDAVVGVDVLTLQAQADGAARALPTFSLGAELGWPAEGSWGWILGARWFQATSATEVSTSGATPIASEASQFFGFLGAQVRF